MSSNQIKRWKNKQKMFNQKYKLKNLKKSEERTRDFSGKFVFLFSSKNICTILKFISKSVCITETALIIDDFFIKQVSRKLVITSKRNKKVLRNCEVKITQLFKESMLKLIKTKSNNSSPELSKHTCEICQEQFSSLSKLQYHSDTLHDLESEPSESDSMVIDDDVELVLDDNSLDSHSMSSSIQIKQEEFNIVSKSNNFIS